MSPYKTWLLAVLAVLTLGCGKFGQVNQGIVVSYDRGRGLITLISDSNYREPGQPRFDVLPPVTIRVPEDPKEMGPAPEPGRLLHVDIGNHLLVVFDPVGESLKTIPYSPLEEHVNVQTNDPRVARTRFPIIDKHNKTISTYSASEKKLVKFTVSDEHLTLPPDTWKAGDEVRYYYKQPDRALRLMNVTRTDITKG